jgi:hypothetical protein
VKLTEPDTFASYLSSNACPRTSRSSRRMRRRALARQQIYEWKETQLLFLAELNRAQAEMRFTARAKALQYIAGAFARFSIAGAVSAAAM